MVLKIIVFLVFILQIFNIFCTFFIRKGCLNCYSVNLKISPIFSLIIGSLLWTHRHSSYRKRHWIKKRLWVTASKHIVVEEGQFPQQQIIFIILKLLFLHDLVWYPHMRSEIIQIVSYYNYDSFQHLNFIFLTKKIVSLF